MCVSLCGVKTSPCILALFTFLSLTHRVENAFAERILDEEYLCCMGSSGCSQAGVQGKRLLRGKKERQSLYLQLQVRIAKRDRGRERSSAKKKKKTAANPFSPTLCMLFAGSRVRLPGGSQASGHFSRCCQVDSHLTHTAHPCPPLISHLAQHPTYRVRPVSGSRREEKRRKDV